MNKVRLACTARVPFEGVVYVAGEVMVDADVAGRLMAAWPTAFNVVRPGVGNAPSEDAGNAGDSPAESEPPPVRRRRKPARGRNK